MGQRKAQIGPAKRIAEPCLLPLVMTTGLIGRPGNGRFHTDPVAMALAIGIGATVQA